MTAVDSTRPLIERAATNASCRSSSGPSDSGAGRITVVLGCFDVLLNRGLQQTLREDRGLEIIGADLDRAALEHVVVSQAPAGGVRSKRDLNGLPVLVQAVTKTR
jgi:hypothetical protein